MGDVNAGSVSFSTTRAMAVGDTIIQLNVRDYLASERPKVGLTPRNVPAAQLWPLVVATASIAAGNFIRVYTPMATSGAGSYEFDYRIDW